MCQLVLIKGYGHFVKMESERCDVAFFAELVKENDVKNLESTLSSLEQTPDFSKEASDGYRVLQLAAILGRSEMIGVLVSKGAPVDETTASGQPTIVPLRAVSTISVLVGLTSLHLAAAWGQLTALKALVLAGANPTLKNVYRESAREVAARYKKTDCASYLETAGEPGTPAHCTSD